MSVWQGCVSACARAQVTTMEARLQEAAGALKAKDDLREER